MRIVLVGGHLNGTGGDFRVIKQISRHLPKGNTVVIVPYLPVYRSKTLKYGCALIPRSGFTIDILLNILRKTLYWFKYVSPYLKFSIKGIMYYFVTLFNLAQFEDLCRRIRPSVIHIHGMSIDSLPFLFCAYSLEIPLVVTSHGLYSLDKNINVNFKRECERDIINQLFCKDITMTAVSSSIIYKMERFLSAPKSSVLLVPNGSDGMFEKTVKSGHSLKELYNIPKDKTVILQVGTLSKRKNHVAVLQALREMPPPLREKILYVIIGDGPEYSGLKNYCETNGLFRHVIFLGKVDDHILADFYKLSDFLILPSSSEGLPLVFLEALAAGLPIITFKDLEGVNDVYQPFCMELIKNKSSSSIIDAITSAMYKRWNRERIITYSKKWSWSSVCAMYLEIYLLAINRHIKNNRHNLCHRNLGRIDYFCD